MVRRQLPSYFLRDKSGNHINGKCFPIHLQLNRRRIRIASVSKVLIAWVILSKPNPWTCPGSFLLLVEFSPGKQTIHIWLLFTRWWGIALSFTVFWNAIHLSPEFSEALATLHYCSVASALGAIHFLRAGYTAWRSQRCNRRSSLMFDLYTTTFAYRSHPPRMTFMCAK